MTDLAHCPHCGVSQQGAEIPEARQGDYGGDHHFSLTIDVKVRSVYDGVLYHQCPDCLGTWHRFLEDNPLRSLAARNMPVALDVPGC
jgi:hypothetical protein